MHKATMTETRVSVRKCEQCGGPNLKPRSRWCSKQCKYDSVRSTRNGPRIDAEMLDVARFKQYATKAWR